MAQYDGAIRINTKINTDGIKKGFSTIKGSADKFTYSINQGISSLNGQISNAGEKIKSMGARLRRETASSKRSVDGLTGSFKKLSSAIISAFAVRKIAGAATSFTELGSDLEEVQNVVDVTFTTMSDKVDAFAKSAAKSAGLSETMAKKYAGTFGAMSKSFGFAEDAALGMSLTLTQLAGDVASFYNISQDEAYTKLKSVFTGETETLKELGVVMTESALNSYAMAKGIGKTVNKMTEQEKVALRYQFVLEKLAGSSGDFVRTQDSWANQTRILKLQIESLKATIGQGLINVLTPLLKMLNTLLEKLRAVAAAFKSFTESFFGKSQAGGSGSGNKYVDTAEDITGSLEDVSDAAQDAEKSLDGYLNPLDEINKYKTGKDDDLLSELEDIDFGNLGDMNFDVTITPEIDDSGISDKFAQIAENIKSILKSLFNPLKEAWDREGKFVMDSWKYALNEVWALIKDIGRDFLTVWQQEATITIFQDILHIIGDIGLVAGNLARNFRKAWSENDVGLHILENIRDIIGIIVGHIRNAADTTVEWSDKLNFYPLLDALNRSLESVKPAVDAISGVLEDFYTKVLLPLGTWTIEKGLPELLQIFIDFNNKVDWESLRANIAELWEHLEPFAETVGEGLIIFIDRLSDVLANFLNSQELKDFLVMIENWMDRVTPEDVANGFEKIAIAIVSLKAAGVVLTGISEAFKTFSSIAGILKGTLSLLHPVISIFSGVLSALASPVGIAVAAIALLAAGFVYLYNHCEEFKNSIDTLYNEHIKPFFDSIANGVGELKDKFMELWDGYVKPMIEEWGQKINVLWEEHLKPMLNNLMELIGKVFDFLSLFWEEVVQPYYEWLMAVLVPGIADVCDIIFNAVDTAITLIADAINGIIDIVEGIIDILIGIATGDWQRVWDGFAEVIKGVAGVIKGIINGIIGVVEGVANAVVAAVNTIIRAINSINFTVPDWVPAVGGQSIGFNIPEISKVSIPRLATGAVIPANREFLAVLGDQKHGTNLEAPTDLIEEITERSVANALSKIGLGGNLGNSNPQTIIVKLIADSKELTDLVIENGKVRQMSSGSNPFLFGTT